MALPTKRTKKEPNYLKKTYMIYGQPKAGKTTVASQFGDDDKNKVLFFATEPGHKFQEIYKWNTKDGNEPTSWVDFMWCVKEMTDSEHDFKCIVIDTVDNLYKWCSSYICKKHRIEHESDLDFGKGYAFIKHEFMNAINLLGQHNIGVIMLSHAQTSDKEIGKKKVSYTNTTLSGSASKVILGLCDYILYFYLDEQGQRFIRTKGTEHFNAGDRSGLLPEIIEMDAKQLIQHLKGGK